MYLRMFLILSVVTLSFSTMMRDTITFNDASSFACASDENLLAKHSDGTFGFYDAEANLINNISLPNVIPMNMTRKNDTLYIACQDTVNSNHFVKRMKINGSTITNIDSIVIQLDASYSWNGINQLYAYGNYLYVLYFQYGPTKSYVIKVNKTNKSDTVWSYISSSCWEDKIKFCDSLMFQSKDKNINTYNLNHNRLTIINQWVFDDNIKAFTFTKTRDTLFVVTNNYLTMYSSSLAITKIFPIYTITTENANNCILLGSDLFITGACCHFSYFNLISQGQTNAYFGNFQRFYSLNDFVYTNISSNSIVKFTSTTAITSSENTRPVSLMPNPTISIFPNPVQSELNIRLNHYETDGKISIIDITGRCVKVINPSQHSALSIKTGNMSPGLYLLKHSNKQYVNTIKFLKTN